MHTNKHETTRRGWRPTATLLGAGLMALLFLAGCGRREGGAGHGHAHVHTAPHGGTLVELGKHQYNLEFVADLERGVVLAYVLDGHAENFVRVAIPEFVVTANAAGKRQLLMFKPVTNAVTGEGVGNTSTFEAEAKWLAEAKAFDGTLEAINVRGTAFTNVTFKFSLPQSPDDSTAKKKK